MLRRTLALAALAVPAIAPHALAQSNAVPGLDILMYDMTDLAFMGRRGPAFPNGESGFMVGHSWCNTGTVNLPWASEVGGVMVDQFPRISFLLVRESNGRMVQISGRSFCKYSPTAFNFSTGPCLPCNVTGGSFFFVGCSDTYGSGINSSQYALGPSEELNPWLGTWNVAGSYFDRGDPALAGAAGVDSVRSLTFSQVQAFDSVKNRIVVRDGEIQAGATYYAQVQAVVQGEPAIERDNNISNRQVGISGSGGTWTTNTIGSSQNGSVLTRWSGATFDRNNNGTGDGSFLVAVKTSGPTAGMYHYEYAIHNIDNHRGGASFRIPVAPGAIVANAGFRDLDTDPLNDWTFSQVGNEVVFTAVGTNALDWNTIYNCWFDCSIAPGAGSMTIDQARPGTGALSVAVASRVPSGLAFANKFSVGGSCGNCTSTYYELFTSANPFDLNGTSTTATLQNGSYTVSRSTVAFVPVAGQNLGLGLSGQTTVTLPFALPYPGGSTTQLQVVSSGYVSPGTPNLVQLLPSALQLMQGQPRWAAFWTLMNPSATSANNVWFDANAQRAILTWNAVPLLGTTGNNTFQIQFFPNGTVHTVFQNIANSTFARMTGWTTGGNFADPGSRDLSATTTPFTLCPNPFDGLALDASANPVLGTTLQWQISGIPGATGWAALLRSLTRATPPIDLTSVGMPGCFAHVVDPVATFVLAPGASVSLPESLPSSTNLIGLNLVGQAVAFNPPLNALGLVVSNATVLSLGL
ncbi:MAG: hypothetical protein ACK501_20855 [Planctomycetota bacterium]|jgi:hypothetical protein